MMHLKKQHLLLFLGIIFFSFGYAQDNSMVVDWADILTEEEEEKLGQELNELEQSIGSQMVVHTIESLEGEKIEEYSLRMANAWEIGRKDYDDGILITVALWDRKVRIEVGYGLEKIIKNEIADQIIQESMMPNFKEENYYEGIMEAVIKIKTLIKENKELVGQHN